jgi:hypothetical protein
MRSIILFKEIMSITELVVQGRMINVRLTEFPVLRSILDFCKREHTNFLQYESAALPFCQQFIITASSTVAPISSKAKWQNIK